VPYDGDCSRVLDAFRKAVGIVTGTRAPEPASGCEWCCYVELRSRVTSP
jgi:hypothetical protein